MQCHVLVMFHTSAVNLRWSNSVEHKTPLVHLLCSVCVLHITQRIISPQQSIPWTPWWLKSEKADKNCGEKLTWDLSQFTHILISATKSDHKWVNICKASGYSYFSFLINCRTAISIVVVIPTCKDSSSVSNTGQTDSMHTTKPDTSQTASEPFWVITRSSILPAKNISLLITKM